MQYNNFQKGRSMLEMLAVLAIVGILSIGGLAGFKFAMDHKKANDMVDYINRVFLAVKSVGEDAYSYAPNGRTYFSCDEIIPEMPDFIYSCGANKVCNGNGASCVTNVFAYFEEGERGAAAALENKLGLNVRDKRPNRNRLFQKSDCVDATPISCFNGFAPCTSPGKPCSLSSREFSSGTEGQPDYYTDANCESIQHGCKNWAENIERNN